MLALGHNAVSLLEVAIRIWVHCGHGGMHMVSNHTETGYGIQAIIVINRPLLAGLLIQG